jgi:hypothetical protein
MWSPVRIARCQGAPDSMSIESVDFQGVNRIASTGVKWARIGAGEAPQGAQDQDRWAREDRLINGLFERKINIFLTISGGGALPRSATAREMPAAAALDAWAEYVRTLVRRYKDRVHYWEIWNEPNEQGMPPRVYAELVKRGSTAIRSVDPQAKVIGASLARVDAPYLQTLFELGVAPYLDVVTYHPYAEIPESSAFPILLPVKKPVSYMEASFPLADLKKILSTADNRIALWQGECGYPSADNSGGWQGRGPWGERIQAKWVLRRLLTDLSMGVEVSNVFALREFTEDNRPNRKGLLRWDTGAPKAAFSSLAFLTSVFDDRFDTVKPVETQFHVIDQGTFYGAMGAYPKEQLQKATRMPLPIQVVAAGGPDGDAVAYWLPWRMQELVHPAKVELKLSGARIKDPVLVNLLDGNVYQIPVKAGGDGVIGFSTLPLADFPFVIVGRNQVKTQAGRFRP